MGSIILDNAVVKEYGFVAAGAVVTPGTKIKKFELWAGNPAKFIRKVNSKEIELMEKHT